MYSFPAPAVPAFPPDQAVTAPAALRYEDVAQDGRMMPIALPPVMGVLWQQVIVSHAGSRNALAKGVIPILTRLTLTSLEQPIRVDRPVEVNAGFELAHARTGDEVTRVFMNVWCEVRGIAGRIGPRQADGALVPAGRVFAEHTFTRPLAPPDQRRVTRLDVAGYPEVPPARYDAPAAATAQDAPDGGRWLDELAADPAETAFTLDQTDSNQHVNSLVYVRVFGDAVQRRLAAAGHPLRVRTQAVDIGYRKPCFAGDRVRTYVRLFELAGAIGAAGYIAGTDDKPRCYVRVITQP